MEQKEVETKSVKTVKVPNFKHQVKKWWLLPTIAVLIITPFSIVLSFPKATIKPTDSVKISGDLFNYETLQASEFATTVMNYEAIQQQAIASVIKVLDIYLTQTEWKSLEDQQLLAGNRIIKEKIVNNLSNKLRLIGLLEAKKTIDLEKTQLLISINSRDDQTIKFSGILNYRETTAELPISGTLNLSQELIEPLKIINNETMPRLLSELKNNSQLRNSIKWNSYGFWYGLETTGDKTGENNQWKGLQTIDLQAFNNVALGWFLDTLKTTNLVDYHVQFEVENLHFYVDGWNKNNLYLGNKDGLLVTDNSVILTADNFPWNDQTNKAASIVSTIDFGWINPLNNEITTINSTGSYILGPVWEYYDQA